MKLKLLIVLLLIPFVSAMQVNFFYSETCPHCQKIFPLVMELSEYYPEHNFILYEVSNEENSKLFAQLGFKGVPAFVINTNDGREIKFVGADQRKLVCEVSEMTLAECPTYSADTCINESWFKI